MSNVVDLKGRTVIGGVDIDKESAQPPTAIHTLWVWATFLSLTESLHDR